MPKKNTGSRVREPVQVYLDRRDRDLLEEVARTTGLSRAEVLRRGLRSLAEQALAEHAPGYSLEGLVGSLGDDATLPRDLAEKHDEYLVAAAGMIGAATNTASFTCAECILQVVHPIFH